MKTTINAFAYRKRIVTDRVAVQFEIDVPEGVSRTTLQSLVEDYIKSNNVNWERKNKEVIPTVKPGEGMYSIGGQVVSKEDNRYDHLDIFFLRDTENKKLHCYDYSETGEEWFQHYDKEEICNYVMKCGLDDDPVENITFWVPLSKYVDINTIEGQKVFDNNKEYAEQAYKKYLAHHKF